MLGLMLACWLFEPTEVVATELTGGRVQGELVDLSAKTVTLATATGEKVLSIEQLIDLRWARPRPEPLPQGQVYLVDGSVISFGSLSTAARNVTLVSPAYKNLTLPLAQVRAIRFGKDADAAAAWNKLLGRGRTKDLLVLPKKKKSGELAPTSGVIGQIGPDTLKFVLGDEEIPVRRNRVYGLIYARKPVVPSRGFVVEVGAKDRLVATELRWRPRDDALELSLANGLKLQIASRYLDRIDCSQGKIRYLDEMKPVFHKFTAVLPDELSEEIFHFRANETMDGQPLRLGGKEYARGLWIHSKTTLRYSLEGQYSRFEAITGIDDDISRREKTKARLTIKADDRALFDQDIWITDKPRELKLDLAAAQTLEIVVDFGEKRADGTPPLHAGLQDWVDLADARVLK